MIRDWFIDGVQLIVLAAAAATLLWFVMKIFGRELHHVTEIFKLEWRELFSRKLSVGSLNLLMLIVVSVVGLVACVLSTSQKVMGLFAAALGQEKAEQLIKSTDYFTVLYAVVIFGAISVVSVVVNECQGRRPHS